MNVTFSEYRPSPALRPYVQTYWRGDFNIHSERQFSQSVLPNGCIELIIHISNDHCSLSKHSQDWSQSPDFTLLGVYNKPYEVQFSQHVQVFGIRFFPDGIRNIFGVPPAHFLATYEDGTDVLGKGFNDFCSKIQELNNVSEQVVLADAFLMRQLFTHAQPYDYTHLAMKLIRQSKGMVHYQELTKQIPLSVRQLQREFKAAYGLTMTDYMRLMRMNTIHNYMLSENISLTQLSYELNFTDQSHFIREFKKYAGIAPKKFIKDKDDFLVSPAFAIEEEY